jgi:plastocyanin
VKRVISITAILASLAVAGQASAANYKVFLGEQSRPPAGVPKGTTLDVFLPQTVTINAGDSVTFSSATFHTVSYGKAPTLIVPDPAHGKYAPEQDAAGKDFFFNGLAKFIYNGQAFAPFGPKTITAGVPASSGALSPSGPKAKPVTFTFTFPKAGSYKLFCSIHPGMKAAVVVKPAGSALPKTPAQVSAQALTDTTAAWNKAKQDAAAAKPPANQVYMGVGKAETIYAYFPNRLTVKAGTTVTFVNKSPQEPHSATFGPKKWIQGFQKKTDLFPMGPKAPNQVAPVILRGTEPAGQFRYDGTSHGNGFFSTPTTGSRKIGPLPISAKVTFTKAGTYKYFCWIHGPEMGGTIVVTP